MGPYDNAQDAITEATELAEISGFNHTVWRSGDDFFVVNDLDATAFAERGFSHPLRPVVVVTPSGPLLY